MSFKEFRYSFGALGKRFTYTQKMGAGIPVGICEFLKIEPWLWGGDLW